MAHRSHSKISKLEPAVALNAGYLVSEVLELIHNDIDIAILDTSAACHMPDVLEMPYRPNSPFPASLQIRGFRLR